MQDAVLMHIEKIIERDGEGQTLWCTGT